MRLFKGYDGYIAKLAASEAKAGGRGGIHLVLAPYLIAAILVSGTFNGLGWRGPIGFTVCLVALMILLGAMLYFGARFMQHSSKAQRHRREWAEHLASEQLRELLNDGNLPSDRVADARHVLWSRGDH